VVLDPSGFSTRIRCPVMLVVCRRVNRISVGLTSHMLAASKSSFRRERLLNPMPRTDTTVPAG